MAEETETPYATEGHKFNVWCAQECRVKHEVALELGVTPQTFGKWMTGRGRPDMLSALRIEVLTEGKIAAKLWWQSEIVEARKIGYDLFRARA